MGLTGRDGPRRSRAAYMAAVGVVAVLWHERRSGRLLLEVSWMPDLARIGS